MKHLIATLFIILNFGFHVLASTQSKAYHFHVLGSRMISITNAQPNQNVQLFSKNTGGKLIARGSINQQGYFKYKCQDKVPAMILVNDYASFLDKPLFKITFAGIRKNEGGRSFEVDLFPIVCQLKVIPIQE